MTFLPIEPISAATAEADALMAAARRLKGLVDGSPRGSETQVVRLAGEIGELAEAIKAAAEAHRRMTVARLAPRPEPAKTAQRRVIIFRAFTCADPIPGFEAVAHCYEERRDKNGAVKLVMLPATAHGPDAETAEKRLKAFIDDQKRRNEARAAHARALGERRRKEPA